MNELEHDEPLLDALQQAAREALYQLLQKVYARSRATQPHLGANLRVAARELVRVYDQLELAIEIAGEEES